MRRKPVFAPLGEFVKKTYASARGHHRHDSDHHQDDADE
jgi:hypothetical protein